MDIQKSIVALTALIGALTGLVMAVTALLTALKKLRGQLKFEPPSGPNVEPNQTRERPNQTRERGYEQIRPSLSAKLRGNWVFIGGIVLILASAIVILYLVLQPTPLRISITQPTATVPLKVKSDNAGSGEYPVEGTYTGDVNKDGLKIYVLVRSASSASEPWYLQDPAATINKTDTWYSRGIWRLEASSVGRGDPSDDLKPGEKWEIFAVIAPNQDHRFVSGGMDPRTIPVADATKLLDVRAQSEKVSIQIGEIER